MFELLVFFPSLDRQFSFTTNKLSRAGEHYTTTSIILRQFLKQSSETRERKEGETVKNADKILFVYSWRPTTIYDNSILMITTIDSILQRRKAYEIFSNHFGSVLCLALAFLFRFFSPRKNKV